LVFSTKFLIKKAPLLGVSIRFRCAETFQSSNEPSHDPFYNSRNSSFDQKSIFFFGKGPSQGRNLGLLGHESQNPDRTIEFLAPSDLMLPILAL
jgi:hypothetical protein